MYAHDYPAYAILFAGIIASTATRKLTIAGALCGGLVGFLIYKGAGYPGLAMLVTFFILGNAATLWQRDLKQELGAAEKNKGKRTAGQVLANGGVAAALGLTAWLWHQELPLLYLLIAAALASATADTLSSELGTVYGRRFYHVLTLQEGSRGMDGIVSTEGTIIGAIGAALIALIFGANYGWNFNLIWIVFAANAGNFADSALGATLEKRKVINNDTVNFLNTLVAALVAYMISSF